MNNFVISLASADVLMGAIVVPGYGAICSSRTCTNAYPYGDHYGLMESTKDIIFLITIFSLLAITYDRNFAVLHPFHYKSKVTRRKVTIILLSVWLIPLPLTALRNVWRLTAKDYEEINRIYDSVLLVTFVCVTCNV